MPSVPASVAGVKYQSRPSDWTVDTATGGGFACLGFEMQGPQYYQYDYKASATADGLGNAGTTFTSSAYGDLNGDGIRSNFNLTGVLTATTGKGVVLVIPPTISETTPEE